METGETPYRFDTIEGKCSILTLFPLINEGQWGNASQVGSEILSRLEGIKSPALVIDLSPLDYMGSAQVALLVRVWKALNKNGGKMVVQCPSDMVREVLTIAGLKSLWTIVPTREQAMADLGIVRSQTNSSSTGLFAIVGLIAALAAGLILGLDQASLLKMDPKIVKYMTLGFGGVGALAGLVSLLQGAAPILGFLALLIGGAAVGVEAGDVLKRPEQKQDAPQEDEEKQAEKGKGEEKQEAQPKEVKKDPPQGEVGKSLPNPDELKKNPVE